MTNENTNRKPRGRAVTTILRDIERAKNVIVKAQNAQEQLTDLEAELEAVPTERRNRELSNAQSAIALLASSGNENMEDETEDSVSSS